MKNDFSLSIQTATSLSIKLALKMFVCYQSIKWKITQFSDLISIYVSYNKKKVENKSISLFFARK